MARRSNQKLKLLYLAKILLQKTDERRGLTLSQILDELYSYGIEAGRKSLYDDIEALRVFGIDVRTKRDRYVRYYVHNRKFDRAELRLLCDIISQSDSLTEKKSNELIKKLGEFGGVAPLIESKEYPKAFNDDTYNNINIICRAIELGEKLTFRCFEWNSKKQRILVRGGEYFTVTPLRLLFENGRYVLIGVDHFSKTDNSFRVDRIINLSACGKASEVEKTYNNADDVELFNLRLRCENSAAGDVFERFGMGVTILSNREDYFEVAVKSALSVDFFAWVFAMGQRVNIVSPLEAVEEYRRRLADNLSATRA